MSIGSLADYQVMFIPTATLAFELSGMHSLLILPSKWSMPMNKLYPLGWVEHPAHAGCEAVDSKVDTTVKPFQRSPVGTQSAFCP